MIKLPAREDGKWTAQFANEKMPDIVATRNITFDKDGFLQLSKPTISWFSNADDADFGVPLGFGEGSVENTYRVWTEYTSFHLTFRYDSCTGAGSLGTVTNGTAVVTQDTTANVPTTSDYQMGDACVFNNLFHVSEDDAVFSTSASTPAASWTSRITGLSTIGPHPLCNNIAGNSLIVGNDNVVAQYNASYATTNLGQLTLPSEYLVKCVTYNNNYIAVGCHDKKNAGNGAVFIWDGKTNAANYAYRMNGASTVHMIAPFRNTFLIFTGLGQVLMWTGTGLEEVVNLPWYYGTGVAGYGTGSGSRNASSKGEGGISYFNLCSNLSTPTAERYDFLSNVPGGIWCYDPDIGMYHRNATTAVKMIVDTIPTTDVNTTDNNITVSSAPETGTPVRYYAGTGNTGIAGLDAERLYYTIKVDATTVKLATTYTNALLGTAVDLTGTGDSEQVLQFYPKSDFGQSYNTGLQGGVQTFEITTRTDGGVYNNGLMYGAQVYKTDTTTVYKAGGMVLPDTENRGYFITSRFQSQQLQDDWQKIFIKHSSLETDLDKIVLKYRKDVNEPIVGLRFQQNNATLGGAITWTDNNTFTSTDTQFANVLVGDEVEIVQGAGSGYLAHVTSISVNTGTYTVNIDEDIKNISTNDTGRAVVSRWTKLTTLTSGTITNEDGYSEIAVGVKSKSIQFKIELRGEDVEIEEILVAHTLHKPVA